MRIPTLRVVALTALIALIACSSGRVIVVRQPAPPPPPPPLRIAPLEITVARPIRGQLLVQTNRPSYVALFEIVPERGVALLAPTYAHQRTWMLAGLNWVPVSWKLQSTMYYGPPSGTAVPGRWVYAIASDVPLRLPDDAFHPTYMRRVLGPAAYRATNPHLTMRAIARAFVPSVIDEAWAEDAYALAATYTSDPYRVVRIYCANRTVYEVPEELADRAWCPVRIPSGGTIVRSTPVRPDSIVVGNGQRARRRLPEMIPVRPPIDRVQEPVRPENAPVVIEDNAPKHDTPKIVDAIKDARDAKEKRGNAYGHTDDPNVKGRGIENEKKEDPRREDLRPGDPRRPPQVDAPVVGNPAAPPEKTEAKEQKREEKQETKQEATEAKQEQKEAKQEVKEAKQEEKEAKQEVKDAKQEEKQAEKAEQKADKAGTTVEPPREPDVPPVTPETKPEKKDDDRSAKEEKQPGKPESKLKKALEHKKP